MVDNTFNIFDFHDYKVYGKVFSSLSDVNLFLKSNPKVNTNVFGSPRSLPSLTYQKLGEPYETCIDYLLGGYSKDIPELLRLERVLDTSTTYTSSERKMKKSVIGSRPNVVNYIAGSPLTMMTKDKYTDMKMINIYYNIQCSAKTSKDQYLHRGILTYELIKLLENSGYNVNLIVFCASEFSESNKSEMFYYQIGIKNPEERFILNEANIFALCAPEMFRRIIFRILESTPVTLGWQANYGTSVKESTLKDLLNIDSSSFLILQPKEMGIEGASLTSDANEFLNKLKLSSKIDINEEAIRLQFKNTRR